jgi:hypothetical protein
VFSQLFFDSFESGGRAIEIEIPEPDKNPSIFEVWVNREKLETGEVHRGENRSNPRCETILPNRCK